MKYYGLIIPSVFPTGVFIQDIKQTASSNESEGLNTMTVTLTNQQKAYFHVKNGKQGSATEATAQMEQHAKEYITSELAEQKKALEQAINNLVAKADLEYKSLIQEKINAVVIKLLQNGYVQWPGMPRPDTLFNFPGYRWAEVNYDGCFFRAKGSKANTFNKGEQGDAIRNIKGSIDINLSTHCYYETRDKKDGEDFDAFGKGVLQFSSSPMNKHRISTHLIENYNSDYRYGTYMRIDSSRSVPTAEENRPRNRTIIIWKLEKI